MPPYNLCAALSLDDLLGPEFLWPSSVWATIYPEDVHASNSDHTRIINPEDSLKYQIRAQDMNGSFLRARQETHARITEALEIIMEKISTEETARKARSGSCGCGDGQEDGEEEDWGKWLEWVGYGDRERGLKYGMIRVQRVHNSLHIDREDFDEFSALKEGTGRAGTVTKEADIQGEQSHESTTDDREIVGSTSTVKISDQKGPLVETTSQAPSHASAPASTGDLSILPSIDLIVNAPTTPTGDLFALSGRDHTQFLRPSSLPAPRALTAQHPSGSRRPTHFRRASLRRQYSIRRLTIACRSIGLLFRRIRSAKHTVKRRQEQSSTTLLDSSEGDEYALCNCGKAIAPEMPPFAHHRSLHERTELDILPVSERVLYEGIERLDTGIEDERYH